MQKKLISTPEQNIHASSETIKDVTRDTVLKLIETINDAEQNYRKSGEAAKKLVKLLSNPEVKISTNLLTLIEKKVNIGNILFPGGGNAVNIIGFWLISPKTNDNLQFDIQTDIGTSLAQEFHTMHVTVAGDSDIIALAAIREKFDKFMEDIFRTYSTQFRTPVKNSFTSRLLTNHKYDSVIPKKTTFILDTDSQDAYVKLDTTRTLGHTWSSTLTISLPALRNMPVKDIINLMWEKRKNNESSYTIDFKG